MADCSFRLRRWKSKTRHAVSFSLICSCASHSQFTWRQTLVRLPDLKKEKNHIQIKLTISGFTMVTEAIHICAKEGDDRQIDL